MFLLKPVIRPTLASEVNTVQERIRSVEGGGSITAMQAVYVPADDMTDPAVVGIFATLDGVVVLSRDLVQRGMYPAIDPLQILLYQPWIPTSWVVAIMISHSRLSSISISTIH